MPTLTKTKPFLKWAGGKTKILPQLSQHLPEKFNRYYEPFLGGGALFFYLQPEKACLSDTNKDLINVYAQVRDNVKDLISYLKILQENHNHDYYYQVRSTWFNNPVTQAAKFIYLNKTCFNGLYRENSKGEFNVPMGNYKKPLICDERTLLDASEALQDVVLYHIDFRDVELTAIDGDFVYFDPPYYGVYSDYTKDSFTAEDHCELAKTFEYLANKGVNVAISNSDDPVIRALYRNYNIHEIYTTRSLTRNGHARGTQHTELLITNY